MPAPPPVVLWLDPGGMTGFAALISSRDYWADEFAWEGACDRLTGWANYYHGMLHIGYEKFTILPGTHKLSAQPEAYEFPGVIKHIARQFGCHLLPPAMPRERELATPAMLQTLGWWVPGKNDAQSAAQHLLAFLLRENCLPYSQATALARARAAT